jgi:hypothetical protein
VTFIGGATHFDNHKDLWKNIFTHVVNGEVKNVYSKQDRILHLYSICKLQANPIGRVPVNQIPQFQNFDISKNVITGSLNGMGHTHYMNKGVLQELFMNVDLR